MIPCAHKYYSTLLSRKGNSLYIDRKIITNLQLHYSDIKFIDYYTKYMNENDGEYTISKKNNHIPMNGDILISIEINAIEQTICYIERDGNIFLSFNVKKGIHNYDVIMIPRSLIYFYGPSIRFENNYETIVKYKWIHFPTTLKRIVENYSVIVHNNIYTPDITCKFGTHYQMSNDIFGAKCNGMNIALCLMILALNDNKSNIQMLNHDILFVILCNLKTLLF